MEHLPPSIRTFESVEQLDELPRELGWPLEYRQIESGDFSSTFSELDGDSWFLMEEQSNRTVEVEGLAPSGMFMLALVEGPATAVFNGQSFTSNQVVVQSPDADMLVTLPTGTIGTQVGIVAEQFEEVIHSVAPGLLVPREGIAVFDAAPFQLERVRWAMRAALLAPPARKATQEESVSTILADLVAISFDHSAAPLDRPLHRAAAQRALGRAREYIEAHLDKPIRIASLCRYSRTTIRSLERVFARELGISPQRYVLARRLNAVRRSLVAADDQQHLRVTDVAQDHGFSHLGRFAGSYRRHFGESPRETLRRR